MLELTDIPVGAWVALKSLCYGIELIVTATTGLVGLIQNEDSHISLFIS